MTDTVLVSFLYPELRSFITEYFDCLIHQDDQDYDLIFFNDGFRDLEREIEMLVEKGKNVEIIEISGSPTEIRFQALKFLQSNYYSKIIFQDADDLMTKNRVSICKEYLQKAPLVVCDLDLIDHEARQIREKVWSERLSDAFEFDYHFIQDQNVVGFGNVALMRDLLSIEIFDFEKSVRVADWFFFYQILYFSKVKAIFTNKARTKYRQHDSNLVGLGSLSQESVEKAFSIKKEQYGALEEVGIDSSKMLKKLREQEVLWSKNHTIKNVDYYPFWWEETTFIK